jgi:hypothetical protein
MISDLFKSYFSIILISIIILSLITHYAKKKELFTTFYKDKQFLGSAELDRGRQPKSTWKPSAALSVVSDNPDFFARFTSFTSNNQFSLDGWTLASSVGTYGNEGLASILTRDNPVERVSVPYNYPRAAGFMGNSLFIQIGLPSQQILLSFEWFGCANVHGWTRNAKNVRLWASNTNFFNSWGRVRQEAVLRGDFTVDQNSGPTPTRVNLSNNPTPFSFYYFDVLNSWGDSSVKLTRIKLTRSISGVGSNLNYETCYQSDDNRAGNQIPRKDNYFCNFGSSGELVPISGTYGIDFTNYNVFYQKIVKGRRLQGNITVDGISYNLDEFGRPTGKIMTLQQSKDICDKLKNRCAGFIMDFNINKTGGMPHFIAELIPGYEDPNMYDSMFTSQESRIKEADSLATYLNFNSYTKKSFSHIEKPVQSLNIPGQEFNRQSCSIIADNDYALKSFNNMTLDDCKAACYSQDDCSGFNRSSSLNDDQTGNCDLKRVNFDFRNVSCPPGFTYNQNNERCEAGWSWACGQDCAYRKCLDSGGNWLWLDYSRNPYTCIPSATNNRSACQNQPGLVSYRRVGKKGLDPIREDDFTVIYNGNSYRCLAGWGKNADYIGCQNSFRDIPAGWRIADDNADSVHVTGSYKWGTHTLVVSNKTVIGTVLWNPRGKFYGWGSTIEANRAKVDYCSGSFLLIKR